MAKGRVDRVNELTEKFSAFLEANYPCQCNDEACSESIYEAQYLAGMVEAIYFGGDKSDGGEDGSI